MQIIAKMVEKEYNMDDSREGTFLRMNGNGSSVMSETHNGQAEEKLLQAWINMSLMIRGNRLVSAMSFNEIVVCRILHNRRLENGEPVTASELCQKMQLLKSQINKILTSMEKTGYLERVRSQNDRRKIEIRLTPAAEAVYEAEHARVMNIIGHVSQELGEEQSKKLTELLNRTVDSIEQLERRQSNER